MRAAIAVPVVALLAGALLCLALQLPRQPATQPGQAAERQAQVPRSRSAPVEAGAERGRQTATNPSPM